MSSRSRFRTHQDTDRQDVHVYLVARRIGAEVRSPVRIGIAKDLVSEVAALQDICPFDITLIHALRLPINLRIAEVLNARFTEKYEIQALNGSWFNLEPAEAFENLLTQLDLIVIPSGESVESYWGILDSFGAGDAASDTLYFLRTDPG